MSHYGRSLSNDVAPVPPREGTLEVDGPTQEHPLRFSQETPFVQVPREDISGLLDLVIELNHAAARQELILSGIERRIPPCYTYQERVPAMSSQPTPARDAHLREAQDPSLRQSVVRQCTTHHLPSWKAYADQPSPRSGGLLRPWSPVGRAGTPPSQTRRYSTAWGHALLQDITHSVRSYWKGKK